MNPHAQFDQELELELELEPERYEFQESGWDFDLGRRDFLRILGGGLLVLCLGQDDQAQERARLSAGVQEASAGAGVSYLARSRPGCTSARMGP